MGHRRRLPTGRDLAEVILDFRRGMHTQAMVWLHQGGRPPVPSFTAWLGPMMEALLPLYTVQFAAGTRKVRRRKSFRAYVGKDESLNKDPLRWAFDLFNPRVSEYIRSMVFDFVESTLATVHGDLDAAIAKLRGELQTGLERGEAIIRLNARVGVIFNDPFKAARIAQTESSRAMHAGQFMQATDHGATGKSWLASADVCELCLRMAAKGTIPIAEPFNVDPKGGTYAVCMFPPIHPHCMCAMSEEW